MVDTEMNALAANDDSVAVQMQNPDSSEGPFEISALQLAPLVESNHYYRQEVKLDKHGRETKELTHEVIELSKLQPPQVKKEPHEKVALVQSWGGIAGLCNKLRTHPKEGISAWELAHGLDARKRAFGTNIFKEMELPNIFELFLGALEDPILRILLVAAAVAIILETVPGVAHDPSTGWIEGVAIFIAVFLVATVTSVNDYSKARKFKELEETARQLDAVKCVRGGNDVDVLPHEIVVGDLIRLQVGLVLPADGLIVSGNDIYVNEAAVTGESILLHKTPEGLLPGPDAPTNKDWERTIIRKGAGVERGNGFYVATQVGYNSHNGFIKYQLEMSIEGEEATPLQKNLEVLAEQISLFGLAVAILTFLALLISFIVIQSTQCCWEWGNLSQIVNFVIISITIIVVAMPEGLPLAVTISLAYSMVQMFKQNILVRTLPACETIGGATNICTDKTGTLTTNVMTVDKVGFAFNKRRLQTIRDETWSRTSVHPAVCEIMEEASVLNCENVDMLDYGEVKENGRPALKVLRGANKTDAALLQMVENQFGSGSRYVGVVRKRHMSEHDPQQTSFESPVRLFPFSSSKKIGSVIVYRGDESIKRTGLNRKYRVYQKGGPDRILGDKIFDTAKSQYPNRCTKYMAEDGTEKLLTTQVLDDFVGCILDLQNNAYRVILLCYQDFDQLDPRWMEQDFEDHRFSQMVIIAAIGIMDPLRDGVPNAVSTCQTAGITVRMVTGDNIDTARAIGRQCHILTDSGRAILGDDFQQLCYRCRIDQPLEQILISLKDLPSFQTMTAEQQSEALIKEKISNEKRRQDEENRRKKRLRMTGWQQRIVSKYLSAVSIMARSQPEHKLLMVRVLMALGEIVAVTGDGTNDANALKESHVGLAMGIEGTDMAKAAADVVILDDNFNTIVQTVKWGRAVNANIRKFVQFQLTVNIVALSVAFVGAVSQKGTPLTAVQLLWVNLIMDTMAALALCLEPPSDELLQVKPCSKQRFISKIMIRNIVTQSVFQLAVLYVILYVGPKIWDVVQDSVQHYTILFNTFVFCQVFNEFNARKINGEINVFSHIWGSWVFFAVIVITCGFQAIIVSFCGSFTQTTQLTGIQWLSCILIGSGALPMYLLGRVIPVGEEQDIVKDDLLSEEDASEGYSSNKLPQWRRIRAEMALKHIGKYWAHLKTDATSTPVGSSMDVTGSGTLPPSSPSHATIAHRRGKRGGGWSESSWQIKVKQLQRTISEMQIAVQASGSDPAAREILKQKLSELEVSVLMEPIGEADEDGVASPTTELMLDGVEEELETELAAVKSENERLQRLATETQIEAEMLREEHAKMLRARVAAEAEEEAAARRTEIGVDALPNIKESDGEDNL